MTQFNAPAYDVERPTGQCAFSGRKLEAGERYMATLVEVDPEPAAPGVPGVPQKASAAVGLKRLDVAEDQWREGHRPQRLFSYWRSTVPQANQKRRLFVDDEVLMSLFRRLADTDQPQRQAFRFVLALILMRKRLLKYEGSKAKAAAGSEGPAQEWWTMSTRTVGGATPEAFDVLNPALDEAQIQQVTQQLGEVLEAEF